MNELQAEQIQQTALQQKIEAVINELDDEFEIVFQNDLRISCYESARHIINALAMERLYRNNQMVDFQKFDLFKVKAETGKPITIDPEEQSVLKIENKVELFSFPEFLVFTSSGNVCKVQNQNFNDIQRIMSKCELEAGEKPIYIMGTKNYSGFLIAGYATGKVAKISMNSFQTEFNRKKLKNAYNTESKLVFIEHITSETDFVCVSTIKKVVVFSTSQINAVESRTTKGVQVLKSKDFSQMAKMKRLDQVKFNNSDYYRSENLNVVGYYLKDGDEL